jgi:DNA-binding FadR family transcriptional regulator
LKPSFANENTIFAEPNAVTRHVRGQVAERIGIGIVKGDILPGEPLPSELRICELMGVSRTVVREAIRMLSAKGFLETRQKSGTRVRSPEYWNHLDPDVLRWRLEATDVDSYLAKLFQLRNALDPTASAMAATAATSEDKARIQLGFDGMANAVDNEAYVVADIDFHKGIYVATHNEFFWPIAQIFEIGLRESFRIAANSTHRQRALAEHREVMNAILVGDPDRAREATITLLEHSATDLVILRGRDLFGGR